MFLKCSGNRPGDKSVGYYKLVESYRDEENRIKHRILINLGPTPHSKADRMKKVLEADRNPNYVATDVDNIIVKSHKEYLTVMTLYHFWQEWGLDSFFHGFDFVVPMVINRCLNPKSKLGVTKWVKKTVLPALFDTSYEEIDSYSIYRELDRLNDLEEKLQQHLCQSIKKKSNNIKSQVFFYDITSTYYEGESCIFCDFGYSRGHRPDRKQIVVALMISEEGFPFYWKVLPDNTPDVTTIAELARSLKKEFKLKDCTLVFDRGMVSEDNLNHLRGKGTNFVTALDRNQISGLELFDLSVFDNLDLDKSYQDQLPAFKRFDKNLYFQEKKRGEMRYVLGFNPSMRRDELKSLQERIDKIMNFFAEKNKELAQAKRSRKKETLTRQIEKKLRKKKLHKIIQYEVLPKEITQTRKDGSKKTVHSFEISTKIKEKEHQKLIKLFGVGCFITELKAERLSAEKLISAYRYKYLIEKSFRIIKNTVKLRPVYLTKKERVKAHVSICVLAYLLLASIDNVIKQDERIDLSVNKILEELSDCKVNTIEIEDQEIMAKNITKPTKLQKDIIEELKCNHLLKKKYYKKFIEIKEDDGV